jgi:hypothetical protein
VPHYNYKRHFAAPACATGLLECHGREGREIDLFPGDHRLHRPVGLDCCDPTIADLEDKSTGLIESHVVLAIVIEIDGSSFASGRSATDIELAHHSSQHGRKILAVADKTGSHAGRIGLAGVDEDIAEGRVERDGVAADFTWRRFFRDFGSAGEERLRQTHQREPFVVGHAAPGRVAMHQAGVELILGDGNQPRSC